MLRCVRCVTLASVPCWLSAHDVVIASARTHTLHRTTNSRQTGRHHSTRLIPLLTRFHSMRIVAPHIHMCTCYFNMSSTKTHVYFEPADVTKSYDIFVHFFSFFLSFVAFLHCSNRSVNCASFHNCSPCKCVASRFTFVMTGNWLDRSMLL